MSFVVVSSHESVAGKDLQRPGDSVAVYTSLALARERYAARLNAIAVASSEPVVLADGVDAGSIMWVMLLQLPIPAEDVDEALETLEIIIEETDDVAGELDDLIVEYSGAFHSAGGDAPYPRDRALENLQAWLS